MKKLFITAVLLTIAFSEGYAVSMDGFLKEIEKNNKEISALKVYREAQTAALYTNIYPEDPRFEAAYLTGNETGINKKGFSISQDLEFPTRYFGKSSLADKTAKSIKIGADKKIKEILNSALKIYIEYVYEAKLSLEYEKRKVYAENLLENMKKRYEAGDIDTLKINKIRIEYALLMSRSRMVEMKKNSLLNRIAGLNGGKAPEISEEEYPDFPDMSEYKAFYDKSKSMDPEFNLLNNELDINEQKLSNAKSSWLPDLSIGFNTEYEPDYDFAGISLGISIPLYKNTNKISAARAEKEFAMSRLEQYNIEFENKVKGDFEMALSLNSCIENLRKTMVESNNNELLKTAFELKQITLTELFIEMHYYYDILERLLEAEKDYFLLQAELYKYF